jgi:hypothetical protein
VKKLFNVLVLTLAINFLAVCGIVAWLYKTGRLSPQNVEAIKLVLFPAPAAGAPATRPSDPATTQPSVRLEELLAKTAGKPAAEQLEYIRTSFDSRMAELDHAQRRLQALQQQVDSAQARVTRDREELQKDRAAVEAKQKESEKLATDKGFQDSLALYESLPGKQVKTIFMALEDETVIRYLQAMEPRAAGKITKEFKAPEEVERLKRLLEKMRQAPAETAGAAIAAPRSPQASASAQAQVQGPPKE